MGECIRCGFRRCIRRRRGSAHDIQLAEHLDQQMLLPNVRYYSSDDPWRLLVFSRKLDAGFIDKIEAGEHRGTTVKCEEI